MTSARDQLLFDTFVTALEGGIGYWSGCLKYHWMHPPAEGNTYGDEDVRGFYAEVQESEDEGGVIYRIDRAVMAKGLKLAATEWRDKLHWSDGYPPLVVTEDTDWCPDAGDADMVVQLGLFGEVVYG